jgi:hypothetical protein
MRPDSRVRRRNEKNSEFGNGRYIPFSHLLSRLKKMLRFTSSAKMAACSQENRQRSKRRRDLKLARSGDFCRAVPGRRSAGREVFVPVASRPRDSHNKLSLSSRCFCRESERCKASHRSSELIFVIRGNCQSCSQIQWRLGETPFLLRSTNFLEQ